MKTILSDHGNNLDITRVNKKQLNKCLKETRETLSNYREMLMLPLTEDEGYCYRKMCDACINDIEIIQNYLIKILI